jgi:hypothetical protein
MWVREHREADGLSYFLTLCLVIGSRSVGGKKVYAGNYNQAKELYRMSGYSFNHI